MHSCSRFLEFRTIELHTVTPGFSATLASFSDACGLEMRFKAKVYIHLLLQTISQTRPSMTLNRQTLNTQEVPNCRSPRGVRDPAESARSTLEGDIRLDFWRLDCPLDREKSDWVILDGIGSPLGKCDGSFTWVK